MQKNTRDFSLLKERILQYLSYKGISKYDCYQKTGITNGVFSQGGGLSEDNLFKFLSYFTDISLEWLLTGEGEMLRNPYSSSIEVHSTDTIDTPENISLIQIIKESNDRLLEMSKKMGALQEKIQFLEKENIDLKEIIKRFKKDIANKRTSDMDANAYCLSPELYSEEFWLRQQEKTDPSDIQPQHPKDKPSESQQDIR